MEGVLVLGLILYVVVRYLGGWEWLAGVILAHRWSLPGEWERALPLGGIAWVTALLFLATGNLWLCLAVHVGLYWGLLRLMRWFA